MANVTTAQIKSALLYKKQEVVELLSGKVSTVNLRLKLWQCGVITDNERSSMRDTCDLEGPMGQARKIVDIVLTRDEQLQTFCKELETLCSEAQSIIVGNTNVLDKISSHIGAMYKARNCHLVQVLPGEKLQLDLHRAEFIMPLIISAEKIVWKERQGYWLPESELRHHYKQVDIESMEGILNNMCQGHESTVLCLGIAGVGKTICAKKILTQWVDGEGDLEFKIVIVVPVRDVKISSPIVDLIGEGEGNLGLANDTMQETLEFFLQEKSIASNMLIIVDGIDERNIPVSSDLYKFITEELTMLHQR